MRPIGIDLFAGAGGLSLGFEQAGFDVLAAVESDPIHCATHKFNFPHCPVFCKSVAEVSGRDIRSQTKIRDEEVAVLFGGSPCQGYSLIGKRAIDDPRNALVREFVRLAHELQPKYVVFENVPGLTVGRHVGVVEEIIAEFENVGYRFRLPYRVLKAVEYGVPQARRRLFLVGAREGVRQPDYPEPSASDRTAKNRTGSLFAAPPPPTVWDAIGDLPDVDEFDELLDSDSVRIGLGQPSAYAARLRGMQFDPQDFGYPRVSDPSVLTSSARTVHTPESMARFAKTPPGELEPISRFLRLDRDGACNTLRAGTGAERGAFTSPRPIHPLHSRCITVREAARLHSYPDWFRFHVTKWHGFRQVGNSVPPLLARAVASCIAAAMDYRPLRPTKFVKLGDPALVSLPSRAASDRFHVDERLIARRSRAAVVDALRVAETTPR